MPQSFALPKDKKGMLWDGKQAEACIHGQHVLDALFIKLAKPDKIVKVNGLPENVIPIIGGSKNVEYTFSSDLNEYIHRSQVWILLNFSMTDYTSQGKTRPKNPFDSEVINLTIPVYQEVQLKVELSLCSHFPLTHHMWSFRIFETGTL